MKRLGVGLGTVAVLAAGLVASEAGPAGAVDSATVTTSGTTVTVTLTGNIGMDIFCTNAVVTIRNMTGSPAVACNKVTKVIVNGDDGIQTVDGKDLDDPAFTAKPHVEVHLGNGADNVTESAQADVIDMGPGTDDMEMRRSAPNTSADLGTGTDKVNFFGYEVAETMTATSTDNVLTFVHTLNGVTKTEQVTNADYLDLNGRAGNDTLDASGVTAASTIDNAYLWGGFGNDVIRGPQAPSSLFGSTGNNAIFGGSANDNIGSDSEGDTISSGGGSDDVFDRTSPRSGRTIDSTGFGHDWTVEMGFGDAISRVRPGANGAAVVVNSLNRPGKQNLPSTFTNIVLNLDVYGEPGDRSMGDVISLAGNRNIRLKGDVSDDDIADITIPYGSWTTTGTAGQVMTINPSDSILGQVTLDNITEYRIHGPWTNANAGFVHRVTRDLMLRFATGSEISTTAVALGDGTTTRTAVVAGLMGTAEYRGLDVDRTFIKYLDRKADPGGRTYWINSIGNGKALWRFRAQLFGSNEYFAKAGGENASYVVKAYNDVLGRDPDPSGKTYWTNKLDGGADRGSVALQFINSPEARRRLVDDQFLRFLGRYPSLAEQTQWTDTIQSSATGEQQLIAFLARSDAYFNLS